MAAQNAKSRTSTKKSTQNETTSVSPFGHLCYHGIYSLKFHLLDHIVEYIQTFGNMSILDSTTYEYFSGLIKQSYISTSIRLTTPMAETVNNMAHILRKFMHSHNTERVVGNEFSSQNPIQHPHLVRDSVSLTLQQFHSVLSK